MTLSLLIVLTLLAATLSLALAGRRRRNDEELFLNERTRRQIEQRNTRSSDRGWRELRG